MMSFHHLSLLFVVLAFGFIWTVDIFPRWSALSSWWMQGHFLAGLLVLLLVIPRFANRIWRFKSIPPITPELTRMNQLLAHMGHMVIYLWMVIMPLLGWALVSARFGGVNVFGLHIPGIVAQNRDTAKMLLELHEACGGIGLLLLLGHGAMALWHHFQRKDTTLVRMFPFFSQKSSEN